MFCVGYEIYAPSYIFRSQYKPLLFGEKLQHYIYHRRNVGLKLFYQTSKYTSKGVAANFWLLIILKCC